MGEAAVLAGGEGGRMTKAREPRRIGKPPIIQKVGLTHHRDKLFCPLCRYDTIYREYGHGRGGLGEHIHCKCGWYYFEEDVG